LLVLVALTTGIRITENLAPTRARQGSATGRKEASRRRRNWPGSWWRRILEELPPQPREASNGPRYSGVLDLGSFRTQLPAGGLAACKQLGIRFAQRRDLFEFALAFGRVVWASVTDGNERANSSGDTPS
jgi:hypothetical protein